MLVLSRKIGERIRIGEDVVLTVVRIHGDKVRLGIEAPGEVMIHREEVYRRLRDARAAQAQAEAQAQGGSVPRAEDGSHPGDDDGRAPAPRTGDDASLSTGLAGR